VRAESVALIPSCTECEARWLPADVARWCAYLTDDEPPEVVFYCPGARSASLRLTDPSVRQLA
jgi:hypothetical protein